MSSITDIWKKSIDTSTGLEDLKIESARKEFLASIVEREAKVAQELAIADRII